VSRRPQQRGHSVLALDLDGTLYSSRGYVAELADAIVGLVGEMLGVTRGEALRMLRKAKGRALTTSASLGLLGINRREFYERLSRIVDPARHIKPNPLIYEMLMRIKARGVKLALHTNAGRPLALKVLSALGLSPHLFDFIITGDEVEPKPSPRGYEYIVLAAGCRPEACIYVGDRAIAELRTAKMMGMLTVKVGGRDSIWADIHVKDILEALERVLAMLDTVEGKLMER